MFRLQDFVLTDAETEIGHTPEFSQAMNQRLHLLMPQEGKLE